MNYSFPLDVAGPEFLFALAGIGIFVFCAVTVGVIFIESLVLWKLKWGTFKRALLAAFVMNLATTILGIGVVPFSSQLGYWGLLIDFALSILLEGLILMLFKRGATRENWIAALTANTASYLLVILPLFLFYGLLTA